VVQNVAWGVAIAVGILLAPVIYTFAKKMAKELKGMGFFSCQGLVIFI